MLKEKVRFKILDLLWNRKPVENLKVCGDVITGARVSEQVSSRVLDLLYGCMDNEMTIKRFFFCVG